MDLARIEALLALLAKHDVTEFQFRDDTQSLRLRLGPPPAQISHMAPMMAQAPSAAPAQPVVAPVAAPATTSVPDNTVGVESPMVGTFYRAAAPGAPPFVEVGAVVRKGQTLCIVEAMKLMNEIESDVSGTVVEIVAQNGQPVQFGQVLIRIQP